MDRRHRSFVRAISLAAAAVVMALAFWSAGLPSSRWLSGWQKEPAHVASQPAATAEHAPAVAQAGEPAASPKRLHLVTTSPGRNAQEGTAQIGRDVTDPQTYAAGALLENGAVLEEIHEEYVLLERDGVSSALYIDGFAAQPQQKRDRRVVDSILLVEGSAAPPIATSGPPTYTTLMRAAPHFDNDLVVGFDVYPGTQSGQFAMLGLRPGDLLVGIDGAPIADVATLNAALKGLSEGRSMTASVRRGDQHLELSLDGAALQTHATTLARAPP